jgi:hypothetical protein
MDKGQVSNYLGNYGVLSSFHEYFNDALRWPAAAGDVTQYCFGLGLVVAVNGNVITSVAGAAGGKVDWVPKDGSRGTLYSGDVTTPPPDETPLMAMSDNPETWPEGYYDQQGMWHDTPGERHWPGHYRVDIDTESQTFGQEVEGEFASDRDIYCVFDDSDNAHPNGAVGIEVDETAFCYGRPYAEDMLFWQFDIQNTSGQALDSVYIGYYAAFRPDYDLEDYISIIDGSPNDDHTNGDFVYVWDRNNTKDGAWEDDPTDLGIVGLSVLETPQDIGVTDFHYFNREVTPSTDEEMWAVLSSNPDDPNLELSEAFFHGADRRMDTTNPDSLGVYFPDGAPINFFIMSGPIELQPSERVGSSVAVVMGSSGPIPDQPDTSDLMENLRVAQVMYQNEFQGSGPPKTPVVQAVPGDRRARIVWDAEAEGSVDVLTGTNDFEGYKIYRSDDQGRTWGTPITDHFGNVIGYQPIKIFDLVDGVMGPDPAYNQSLGNDSGLQHSYTDSNLINGLEYWYCVTAFDKGNQNPDSLEQSYQSSLGHSIMEPHTVAVIPAAPPLDQEEAAPIGVLSPQGGPCEGLVSVDIIDPEALTGHGYKITFDESLFIDTELEDTLVVTFGFTLVDTTEGDTLLARHPFSDESGDNLPVVDGFRLQATDALPGSEYGWTSVAGDTCSFDWYTEKKTDSIQEIDEEILGVDDFRIEVVDTSEGTTVALTDGVFGIGIHSYIQIPIKVHLVTDPTNPIDVSEYTQVFDLRVAFPTSELLGPLGWDLIPGGAGYNPTGAGEFWPDILALNAGPGENESHVWLKTQNGPETATAPSIGDEFTITTSKPFREEIYYVFGTSPPSYTVETSDEEIDLSMIRVVPDPYIVSNIWESSQFGKRLQFNHLPSECTIKIFTVAGDHIRTIHHNDNKGYEFWDMRTYNDQYIAYGLYVYLVSLPNGQSKTGRFLVIR